MICCFQLLLLFLGLVLRHDTVFQKKSEKSLLENIGETLRFHPFFQILKAYSQFLVNFWQLKAL